MSRLPTLWKANLIAFSSSFCVMVIELVAARILAPYIGVSLYTWTSIIGVILAGIALGNYLGGKLADRRPSPILLMLIFFAGALATILILPTTKIVAQGDWFGKLPVMWNFALKTSFIFFLPAIILSMVSPMVIKLTLVDLGRTGGIVGTIYAFSTAGAILGTFLTGFYLILWFGTAALVWLVASTLILTGILTWLVWTPHKFKFSTKNFLIWMAIFEVILAAAILYQFRSRWEKPWDIESSYYAIRVLPGEKGMKLLVLDDLIHSYVDPQDPTKLEYFYLRVFEGIVRRTLGDTPPRTLHLGAGGYSFSRYLETVYPGSINHVVEIDPAVTQISYEQLGLSRATSIKTFNMDARQFFIRRVTGDKYDIVIGDVFNSRSAPYHLTTREFDQLIEDSLSPKGIYLLNIIDDFRSGRYMASLIYTLQQVFQNVHLFNTGRAWEDVRVSTYVVVATNYDYDFSAYKAPTLTPDGKLEPYGRIYDGDLAFYLADRKAVLLTDDYAPTDILIAPSLARMRL